MAKAASKKRAKTTRLKATRSKAIKPDPTRSKARSLKPIRKAGPRIRSKTAPFSESNERRSARASRILAGLHKLYPVADCALHHADPWQLLIATILSAQSTDETVNRVTPALFERYPNPKALADANADEVEHVIHATGFFRQKTKSIQGASRMIADEFDSRVPNRMVDLLRLPGVARKTANVVLGTAFGMNEGVVVDTHVGRLATRMKLTWQSKNEKDAPKIEVDLQQVIPRSEWTYFGHAMIWHGRKVCNARKPLCSQCTLSKDCPSAHSFGAS